MPPVAIGAGIAAVGSIGGAILSSSAQKKAAKQASGIAADNTAANNALTREIYAQNASRLDPYSQAGLRAGNALQGLLGINNFSTGVPAGGSGGALGGGGTQNFTAEQQWAQGAINAMLPRITRSSVREQLASMTNDPVGALNYLMTLSPPSSDQYPLYQAYLSSNPRPTGDAASAPATGGTAGGALGGSGRQVNGGPRGALGGDGTAPPTPAPTTGAPAPTTGGTPATQPVNAATAAWDAFRNSTNYQFRFDQGQKALLTSALPSGGFDSGATRKAIVEYGQNFASNELSNYMDRLAQQQSIGLSGASALAGVGQNMVGAITANNNSAASAAANSALARGSATASMWGGIANGIGTAVGALGSGGSIYGSGGGGSGGGSFFGIG